MARQKLKNLNDSHHAAIRMKIEGKTCRQIAEAVEVEIRTVYLWFSDPLVKGELDRARGRIFELFAEKITDVGMQAMSRLEELLELPIVETQMTIEQKLEVTKEVLDRIPITSKSTRPGFEGTPSQPIPGAPMDVPNVSDSDLFHELKEVVQLLPGITVVEEKPKANGRRASK